MMNPKSKTQQHVDFIREQYNQGIEQIHRTQLPHPNCLRALKSKAPIVAITDSGVILICTKE